MIEDYPERHRVQVERIYILFKEEEIDLQVERDSTK